MKLKNKKIIAIMIFLGLSFVFGGSLTDFALAENTSTSWDQYTPLAPLPGTTQGECVTDKNGKVSDCTTDIQTYLPGIFKLAIGIAGVLAVLMIIIGGVEYITTDAIQGKSEGKARIQNALWGLVLVLVSWILLYTINPKLTVFNLNVEKTTVADTNNNSDSNGDYSGTGAALTNDEETSSYKNGDGYTVSKHTSTTNYEDGTYSYVITETYTDKNGDIYTTKTTKDKNDVFSTTKKVQRKGTDYDESLSDDDEAVQEIDIPEEIDWSSEPIAI